MKVRERRYSILAAVLCRTYVYIPFFGIFYAPGFHRSLLVRVNALERYYVLKKFGLFAFLFNQPKPIGPDDMDRMESVAAVFPQLYEAVP